MSRTIKFVVIEGPAEGREFLLDATGTGTASFGRQATCECPLVEDLQLSRRHFQVDVTPSSIRLQDLGSLNGTFINGIKYGGRTPNDPATENVRKPPPAVDLKEGDRIKAGQTQLRVTMENALSCSGCSCTVADADERTGRWVAGKFLCKNCMKKAAAGPPRCAKCGRQMAADTVAVQTGGERLCPICREHTISEPTRSLPDGITARNPQRETMLHAIEGYELGVKIGQGTFGAVHIAKAVADGSRVAVKLLASRVAVNDDNRRRFFEGVEMIKAMHHQHIVALLDYGVMGGTFYLVMEYCNGGNLDSLMRRRGGKLAAPEAVSVMLQALDGLIYAHNVNVVHRFLKPANILLSGREGHWDAKVSDFGLVRHFETAGFAGAAATGGLVPSVVPFMPREQVANPKLLKQACDVWSMGAILYYLLSAKHPRDVFEGQDPAAAALAGSPIPILKRDPRLPIVMAKILDKALADQPAARYQSAAELRTALVSALPELAR